LRPKSNGIIAQRFYFEPMALAMASAPGPGGPSGAEARLQRLQDSPSRADWRSGGGPLRRQVEQPS